MIYFRQLKSGNYKLSNSSDCTTWCIDEKDLKRFWDSLIKNRIIKATYSQSQTYFRSFDELLNKIKK